jgi:hypothetical protein
MNLFKQGINKMPFCIRNELHHVNKNWVSQATEALMSITSVTKAFNNSETLIQCKKRIENLTAIGLSQPSQMYLHIALHTKRRESFNVAAFKALDAQKQFIKTLKDE